jgi:hypothetical protein
MSAKGHCELIKEADLAEEDLPRSRRPFTEEADLSAPLLTGKARFRCEPQRYLRRLHHADLTTDLERLGVMPVRRRPDLSCYARCSKHSLGAGVDQGKEGSLLRSVRTVRAYKSDVHDWPVDVSPRRVRSTARGVFRIGEDPGKGATVGQWR